MPGPFLYSHVELCHSHHFNHTSVFLSRVKPCILHCLKLKATEWMQILTELLECKNEMGSRTRNFAEVGNQGRTPWISQPIPWGPRLSYLWLLLFQYSYCHTSECLSYLKPYILIIWLESPLLIAHTWIHPFFELWVILCYFSYRPHALISSLLYRLNCLQGNILKVSRDTYAIHFNSFAWQYPISLAFPEMLSWKWLTKLYNPVCWHHDKFMGSWSTTWK